MTNKITSYSKIFSGESLNDEGNNEIEPQKERYISPAKRQPIIDEFRLV